MSALSPFDMNSPHAALRGEGRLGLFGRVTAETAEPRATRRRRPPHRTVPPARIRGAARRSPRSPRLRAPSCGYALRLGFCRLGKGDDARRHLVVLAVLAAVVLAVVIPASAITNGQPDGNAHRYVGLVVFDVLNDQGQQVPSHRCSASLLSPTVFLTAGHCTDGTVAARVWFDENVQGNTEYPFSGATSYDGTPYTNPGFCIGCGQGLPGSRSATSGSSS